VGLEVSGYRVERRVRVGFVSKDKREKKRIGKSGGRKGLEKE